jgi:transcriptional regulator with XRE-family HTH domain
MDTKRPWPGPVGLESLGRMLRRLRLDSDLTLERLAEVSGISDRTLSDIERGAARGPQHRTMLAIAAGLGLSEVDGAALVCAAREGRRRNMASSQSRLPLPGDVEEFTGREVELSRIASVLTDPRNHQLPLVIVTGPPGYGKTSLAVRAASLLRRAFPEQVFVPLGGLTPEPPSPDAVVARIVQALTGHETTRTDVGQLPRLLADRQLLLVLDDAACESQVRAVLPAAGRAAVLVTSRRSLAGLHAAERLCLDRLGGEDAVRLLGAIIPPEQTAGADLAELARLCDDVPLALRIAGNRLASRPGWTVMALTARLAVADRRLRVLTAGDLGMSAAIRQSFIGLDPAAQRLFARLALVDGSTFGAGLAGALIGGHPWHAEELLDQLADVNLVQPTTGDRYTLHELLRLYARAELERELPSTRAAIREASDAWLLATAARAARLLRSGGRAKSAVAQVPRTPPDLESPRAWLTDEAENWSAALGRLLRPLNGELVAALPGHRHVAGPAMIGGRIQLPLGERLVQLPPGADLELGEDLSQVPLDRTAAQVQLGADLGIGQSVAGQPGDLRLLRRELLYRVRRTLVDRRPGRQQLSPGAFGEGVGPHPSEHVVATAQVLPCVHSSILPTQPLPVEQVAAGQFGCGPAAAEPINGLAIQELGAVAVGHEGAAAGLDAERPLGSTDAGTVPEPAESAHGDVLLPGPHGCLDQLHQCPARERDLFAFARPLRSGECCVVAPQTVLQHRGRQIDQRDRSSLSPCGRTCHGGLEQGGRLVLLTAPGTEHQRGVDERRIARDLGDDFSLVE